MDLFHRNVVIFLLLQGVYFSFGTNLDSSSENLTTHVRVKRVPTQNLSWIVSGFSPCTHTCLGGIMTRSVKCIDENGLISDRCTSTTPEPYRICNSIDCVTGNSLFSSMTGIFSTTNPDSSTAITDVQMFSIEIMTRETNGWTSVFTANTTGTFGDPIFNLILDYIKARLYLRSNLTSTVIRFDDIGDLEFDLSGFPGGTTIRESAFPASALITYTGFTFAIPLINTFLSIRRVLYFDSIYVHKYTSGLREFCGPGYYYVNGLKPSRTVLVSTTSIDFASLPNNPAEIRHTIISIDPSNYTITLEWDLPKFGGTTREYTSISYYILTGAPINISEILSPSDRSYNVTLFYNRQYLFGVSVENDRGVSNPIELPVRYVTCGVPILPGNSTLDYFSYIEGGYVSYSCDEGFQPNGTFMSVCTNDSVFMPPLYDDTCKRAIITIDATQQSSSTIPGMNCPGDITTYRCSILSSYYDTLHLTWRITVPGQIPISITYNSTTPLGEITFHPTQISTNLSSIQGDDIIVSFVTLTVLKNVTVNGTKLECGIGGLDEMTVVWTVNIIKVPDAPTSVNITNVEMATNVSVTLEWDRESVVENYNIRISPSSVLGLTVDLVISSRWNVTLNYNVRYMVNITAVNCAGSSTYVVSPIEVSACRVPQPPDKGSILSYDQREGGMLKYQCDFGYLPSTLMSAICINVTWTQAPEDHNCRFSMISSSLSRLDRIGSDVDCPGDIVSYKCIIVSNMALQLTWNVTFPDELITMPISITYNNQSILNGVDSFPMNISTTLIDRGDVYLMSIINFTVGIYASMNETELECRVGDLDSTMEMLFINRTKPPVPTGFHVANRSDEDTFVTVMLAWLPKCCDDIDSIIDHFVVSFASDTVVFNDVLVFSPFWSVSVEYGVDYTVSITAVNCIGGSSPLVISNFSIAKCSPPLPPISGVITTSSRITQGSMITFICNNNPNRIMASFCTNDAVWEPDPEKHVCIIIKEPFLSTIAILTIVVILVLGAVYLVSTFTCIIYQRHKEIWSWIHSYARQSTSDPEIGSAESLPNTPLITTVESLPNTPSDPVITTVESLPNTPSDPVIDTVESLPNTPSVKSPPDTPSVLPSANADLSPTAISLHLSSPLPSNQELELEIKMLKENFEKIVEPLKTSLLESNVSVKKVQRSIKHLPVSLNCQLGEYFREQTSKIFKMESMSELIELLSWLWDYLNPGLLTYFVGRFGSDDNRKCMEVYLEDLKKFQMNMKLGEYLCTSPEESDACSHHFFKRITTHMGEDWEEKTLQDVEEYKNDLSKELNIQIFLPRIYVMRPNIVIVFSIPHWIKIDLQELKPFFYCKEIKRVYLNDVCLIDWTKEHYTTDMTIPSDMIISQSSHSLEGRELLKRDSSTVALPRCSIQERREVQTRASTVSLPDDVTEMAREEHRRKTISSCHSAGSLQSTISLPKEMGEPSKVDSSISLPHHSEEEDSSISIPNYSIEELKQFHKKALIDLKVLLQREASIAISQFRSSKRTQYIKVTIDPSTKKIIISGKTPEISHVLKDVEDEVSIIKEITYNQEFHSLYLETKISNQLASWVQQYSDIQQYSIEDRVIKYNQMIKEEMDLIDMYQHKILTSVWSYDHYFLWLWYRYEWKTKTTIKLLLEAERIRLKLDSMKMKYYRKNESNKTALKSDVNDRGKFVLLEEIDMERREIMDMDRMEMKRRDMEMETEMMEMERKEAEMEMEMIERMEMKKEMMEMERKETEIMERRERREMMKRKEMTETRMKIIRYQRRVQRQRNTKEELNLMEFYQEDLIDELHRLAEEQLQLLTSSPRESDLERVEFVVQHMLLIEERINVLSVSV